jgi:hypothetical protein
MLLTTEVGFGLVVVGEVTNWTVVRGLVWKQTCRGVPLEFES